MSEALKRAGYAIAGAVVALLFMHQCKGSQDKPTQSTTTKTVYVAVKDSSAHVLTQQTPEKVPVFVYKDKIVYRDKAADDAAGIDWIDGTDPEGGEFDFEMLNVYKDSTILANAKVYSKITTDGTIYKNEVTAEVTNSETTKTVTNTVNASGWFLSAGAGATSGLLINNFNAGFDYIHKNDYGAGIQVQYNTITKEPVYGVRVLKKIF